MTTALTRVLTAQMHGIAAFEGEFGDGLGKGFFKKLKKVHKKHVKFTKKIHFLKGVNGEEYFDLAGYGEDLNEGMGDYAHDDYDLYEEVYDDNLGKSFFKKLLKPVKKITKGVKKVIKSPAFKKLAIIGGVVAAGMFLGPMAAGLVKKGAAAIAQRSADKRAAKQAAAEAPAVTQEMLNVLNNPQVIDGIRTGRIPPPPTDLNSSAFADWATSIGMSLIPASVQSGLSPYDRSAMERSMRYEVMEQQSYAARGAQRLPSGSNYSPMPEIPEEIQGDMLEASKASPKTIAIVAGAALLGLTLLSRKGRR